MAIPTTDPRQYPANVSRTLDPSGKSLVTVVGLHDFELSDADFNLSQDLSDFKRTSLLEDITSSGCIQLAEFQFSPSTENTFYIPAFDVLFQGEVVHIAGNLSADITTNRVVLPPPQFYQNGATQQQAQIYVVFLEIFYAALNPDTGAGYTTNANAQRCFYGYGCVNCDPSNLILDDSIDPFQGITTTNRAQIQWRISVQPVALTYNFGKFQFGLDSGATQVAVGTPSYGPDWVSYIGTPSETVWAEGIPSNQKVGPVPQAPYQFVYLGAQPGVQAWNGTAVYVDGSIVSYAGAYYICFTPNTGIQPPNAAFWNVFPLNGDSGLWAAGDGNVNNSLGTMDGYSYAMPLALVFQRNIGVFDVQLNPFGCGDGQVLGSGVLQSGLSGRYDGAYADGIQQYDVIDTRSTINLRAWDFDRMVREGFTDLVSGNTTMAIARGDGAGQPSVALGSELTYFVAVNPIAIANTVQIGTFDGFQNGFSSDDRTFYSSQAISVQDKTTGVDGGPWLGPQGTAATGDSFTISLPTGSQATITYVQVQALVSQQSGGVNPVLLLQGQLNFVGLGTTSVTVQIAKDLTGTAYDPGQNDLYVTVGVTYPAGAGMNLVKIPSNVDGGVLVDAVSGVTYPVNGVSDYQPSAVQPINTALNVVAINPNFSNLVFGLRVWIQVPGSSGTQATVNGNTTTTFIIPRAGLNNEFLGMYPIRVWDDASQNAYTVQSVSINGTNMTLVLVGAVPSTSTVDMTIICVNTCQLSYNAPVQAATAIEETVLIGNTLGNQMFPVDSRVVVTSVVNNSTENTVTLAGNGAILKGISGNDSIRYIFVADNFGNWNSVQLLSVSFQNSIVVFTAPPSVNLTVQPWFAVAGILPAHSPSSKLILSERYVPYQGEGIIGRNYEIVHTEDNGLVSTNGTGAAPIVGLADVYPYNRELPIVTMLPSNVGWTDSSLNNEAIASFFDSNYVAKQFDNVEDTFEVPLHTNDFIQPMYGGKRNQIQFVQASGNRGFGSAVPHMGFAIAQLTPKSVLGQNLIATTAPITLYVNNASGNDNNDGLSAGTPFLTIGAAIAVIPPVLRNPVTIILAQTGKSFVLAQMASQLITIPYGDGVIRPLVYYALANLGFTIQGEGRLVISGDPASTTRVTIDATGYTSPGNGPTSAFYMDTTRVIFQNLEFRQFVNAALYGADVDCSLVNCKFTDCLQAGAWSQASVVVIDGGEIEMTDGDTGHVLAGSQMVASGVTLTVDSGTSPGAFYVAERGSSLTLQTHNTTEENNVTADQLVASATINSDIVCNSDFTSGGAASITVNSSLEQAIAQAPFAGGVTSDASSSVVTNV